MNNLHVLWFIKIRFTNNQIINHFMREGHCDLEKKKNTITLNSWVIFWVWAMFIGFYIILKLNSDTSKSTLIILSTNKDNMKSMVCTSNIVVIFNPTFYFMRLHFSFTFHLLSRLPFDLMRPHFSFHHLFLKFHCSVLSLSLFLFSVRVLHQHS